MKPTDVIVVDYGCGNILSVKRGLETVGARVVLTDNPQVIKSAKHIVLPGVGAFANGMKALSRLNAGDAINRAAENGANVLGICLGMQMLMDESEEFGKHSGLGLIPGKVVAIPAHKHDGTRHKVPNIGWNELRPTARQNSWKKTILDFVEPNTAVYFVHSFMAVPDDDKHIIADYNYGGHDVVAAIGNERIYGCQFHPEKSGQTGLRVLERFVAL
jgi:glutamine amidotransferase